jgi:hypothetical protein
MKIFALVFATAASAIAAPAFAGSPADANNPIRLAQVDVRIGDRDRDQDRDRHARDRDSDRHMRDRDRGYERHVRLDRDRDRCHTRIVRGFRDGEFVVRRERYCD